MKNNKYLILSLLFAILNMAAIFWFWGFREYDDSSSYIDLIHRFEGRDINVSSWRMLTPLGSLIALPFEFLGEGAGLIIQNILFYFFSVYLIFRIIELVFYDKELAFWGVMLFTAALPILFFGLSYLTDMGAWFFFLLSIYLTLLYLRKRDEKLILINGLFSGTGVLLKANGGLGILFFIMIIFLSDKFNLRDKFLKILKFTAVFLIPIAILQIFTFAIFRYTYLQGYIFASNEASVSTFKAQPGSVYEHLGKYTSVIYAYSGEFLKAFGMVGLFFSLLGLLREYLQKDKERLKIYLALLPFSFSFLVYPPTDSRFAFISTPLLILLAVGGLAYLRNFFSGKAGRLLVVFLIAGYIFSNYYFLTIGSYRKIFLLLIGLIKQ